MRVVHEDPVGQRPRYLVGADTLDDLDASVAEDLVSGTVDERVGIADAYDDAPDAVRDDGASARRGAAMERARLEGRVQRHVRERDPSRFAAPEGDDLRVIFSGPLGVSASQDAAVVIADDA